MKAFTDISQSKRLAKILPKESADMCYCMVSQSLTDKFQPKLIAVPPKYSEDIPAWSLAALLEIIPKDIEGLNRLRIDIDNVDFSIWYDDLKGYGVNTELPDITSKEPVDACYEMILKLHESKLL